MIKKKFTGIVGAGKEKYAIFSSDSGHIRFRTWY